MTPTPATLATATRDALTAYQRPVTLAPMSSRLAPAVVLQKAREGR